MNNIKTESEDTICRGCLSADRRLSPLPSYALYFSLLDEKQKIEALRKPYIVVCWECTAALKRMQSFRAQAQRAHTILEESLTMPAKNTLSRLTIKIKDKYDACFEDSISLEQSHTRIPSVDIIKHETRAETNETANDKNKIKIEKSTTSKKTNVPPKKRKAKTKSIDTKKRRISFDEPIINLKAKKTNAKNKSSNDARKSKRHKTVENEMCDLNNDNSQTDDKVQIKVELTDNIDDNVHWMEGSDYADEKPTSTNDNDSDFSYKDDKEKSKDVNKRILTYKRTIVQYPSDVSNYFTEIEMSEEEMRSVLEKQQEIVNKSKPYKCEFCGVSFRQRKTLTGHISHRHKKAKYKEQIKKEADPDSSPEKHFLYRCSLCDRILRKEHMQSHLAEYHRHKYQCVGCPWSEAFFWSREQHARHWQDVHAQLECDICRQTRRNAHDMERHMRASHLPIKCPQCQRVYSKWKYYRQHQKMAHPVLALEPPESRYCVECDMQFPSIMAYKMHVMNHHRSTPKKRWPCPACNKTLNNKDTMKKHYALFHSDKTSYQCQHCGKYLSSKCSLQQHLNSHLNIKLPKDKLCSICGRGFSTRRMLRFHTYTHTGERPYACPHCPAAFTQPNPLRVHARKQHPLLPVQVHTNPHKQDK